MSSKRKIYYSGEHTCTGVQKNGSKCTNKAYYMLNGALKCGHHANAKTKRTKLKSNPRKKELRNAELEQHKLSVSKIQQENQAQGICGTLSCQKMRMMKNPILSEGVLLVFPNNKHQNRSDGFGCASLSPMQLGPVKHGQPGLPDSLTIENYHQFNKVFPNEQDEKGNPLPIFYEKRNAAYIDPIPHRHKYDSAALKKMNKNMVNGVNTPMYCLHLDANGTERRYSYVESRFFYCHWYEVLAKTRVAFTALQTMLQNGTNLCITGYDAYQPDSTRLYEHYCDSSKPFGHELVLYTLLSIQNPYDYPWNRFYREHSDLYDPLSFHILV